MCLEFVYFSIYVLSVFPPWFLRDGNAIFFTDIILLIISTFIFSSWDKFCFVVFVVWCLDYSCFVFNSVGVFMFFII